MYVVLAVQKAGYPVDEVAANEEKVILNKEQIPSWMEFNILYFFNFVDFNDASEHVFKIPIKCAKQRNYRSSDEAG